MFFKKSNNKNKLNQCNYGREYGWFIEHETQKIGELNHCEFDDMFWDRYTIFPYDGFQVFLFDFQNWLQHSFQYPNKYYQQYAKSAVFGIGGISVEENKHTILMRGLYLSEINQ